MISRSKGEYQRAVEAARAAISNRRAKPPVRADRSPEALLAEMRERQAKGTLTAAHFEALEAALSRQSGTHRRRGRPKGTRDKTAVSAFVLAAGAVEEFGLPAYRNQCSPHRFSLCDAIAEAMHAEGFRTFATYDAAANEMKLFRKVKRNQARGIAQFRRNIELWRRQWMAALGPLAANMRENSEALRQVGAHLTRQFQVDGNRLRGVAEGFCIDPGLNGESMKNLRNRFDSEA